MVVGRSEFSLRAASDALPMRDAFAVLFFVSIGMLFDPQTLTNTPGLVAATIAVIVIGKPLAALAIVLFLRYPLKVALAVAVALAQIGEFSFILATRAREMGILTDEATHCLVAASIVSITISPLLYRITEPVEAWIMRQLRLREWLNARVVTGLPRQAVGAAEQVGTPSHRAIVVGYGPVGETVTRLLRDNEIEPTVIELNLETVRRLRESGVNAVYGDASLSATLASAGAASAGTLILSASGVRHCEDVIRLARGLNPDIRVLARADYVREVGPLREAGAARVFSGEGEVALALIEEILRSLGATGEQIDRERDRFRREALG
jgi:CPA2 family monovalent cation:H+ antiporter-2